jgi:hypothetical protein
MFFGMNRSLWGVFCLLAASAAPHAAADQQYPVAATNFATARQVAIIGKPTCSAKIERRMAWSIGLSHN